MKSANFILTCFSLLLLSSILGCASLGGEQAAGINWALKENGGKITVFSDDPGHPASTLNNGVTSSENWNQGEGWQASMGGGGGGGFGQQRFGQEAQGFGAGGQGQGRGGGGRGGFGGMGQDRNWVIIDLPQTVSVSHVTIHTIDSEEYPAKDFGVSYLLVQYESESTLDGPIWKSTDKYGKGVGAKDNIVRDNVKGTIDVRFTPVRTKRIRILIYATNDMASSIGSRSRGGGMGGMGGGGRGGGRSSGRGGTIRLTEIEVFGT